MQFDNVYDDARRAEAYARLQFPGTYYLAYRDLPDVLTRHVSGTRAIDFGCGTGRSTRFLRDLGFDVVGVDVSADMLRRAEDTDAQGDYRLVEEGDLSPLDRLTFDLALSVFTFDNIPTAEKKVKTLRELGGLLKPGGTMVNLVSSPEIYTHEWASFTTRDFPENQRARSGDRVRIVVTDLEDPRPVEDILWTDDAYREVYRRASMEVVRTYKPLAEENEPYEWVNETRIAPWVIYVLRRRPGGRPECPSK